MDHSAHNMNEYRSMMFMEGHAMKPGQMIEPLGSPSPTEVEYKVFDIDVRIVEHEILPGVKSHICRCKGFTYGFKFVDQHR